MLPDVEQRRITARPKGGGVIALKGRAYIERHESFGSGLWVIETREPGGRWRRILETGESDDIEFLITENRTCPSHVHRVRRVLWDVRRRPEV